jgi:hypothetical protein
MIKDNLRTINIYKTLKEWFDPAIEGDPYKNISRDRIRVTITLNGVAKKTVCIVR